MTRLVWKASVVVLVAAVLFGCSSSPKARRDKYLARGKEHIQKKDYARALLDLRNAAKAIPNDAEVYYEIGLAFVGVQDFNSAHAAFREALSRDPKHAGAQLKIAQLQMHTNDPDMLNDSVTRLKALLEGNSPTSEMLNALAFTELKLGDPQNAVGTLEQALALAPQELSSVVMLVQAKLSLKDIKGAQAVLEKAASDAPKSAAARALLGEFFVGQNKPADAEAAFRQALALDPNHEQALLDLGYLESSQGRKQEAEQCFKKLSAIEGHQSSWAIFLYQEGRRDEAVREFERLYKQNPDNRQMRTNLILAYRNTNHSTEVDKLLEKALQKNSKDADARLQHAEVSIEKGQYAQAEIDLNQLLKLRPDAPEGHYVRARLNLAQGRTLIYRQELSEVLRLNPELLVARVELAQNLLDAKDGRSVLALLDAAPARQRSEISLLIKRNWALWITGNLPEMRKGIDAGLAQTRSPELLLQDGIWKLRSGGNPSGARASLEEALKVDPGDVRALSALRQSYELQKQSALAVEKVKEYAAREPRSAPVQNFLGTLLLTRGDRAGARTAFEAAKTADPHSIEADFSLIQVYLIEGKLDEAKRGLQAILSTDPTNKNAHLWLGNVESSRGDYRAALEQFRTVVAAWPDNPEALNNLAYLLAEFANQPAEALKYAQKAKELVPDNAEYSDTLGWVLYHQGLYPMAVKELERATAKQSNVTWQYHLAMAYAKAGDWNRGRAVLKAALEKNPKLPEAQRAREVLDAAAPLGANQH